MTVVSEGIIRTVNEPEILGRMEKNIHNQQVYYRQSIILILLLSFVIYGVETGKSWSLYLEHFFFFNKLIVKHVKYLKKTHLE